MATDELAARRELRGQKLSINALVNRTLRSLFARLSGQHFGGERDLYEQCGYPVDITPQDYVAQYLRGDLAARIVDAYPDATWREAPIVKTTGTTEGDEDPFQAAIDELNDRFGLWSVLHRLDLLTQLGHYGVLLIGLDGGAPLDQPVDRDKFGLLYLAPFGEAQAEILRWESNTSSPRFGKPELYRLTAGPDWKGISGMQRNLTVHWSRVIHVAERALDDESIGLPRLERIWNRVMDCEKLLGASAEIFWQNAAPTRAWMADADTEFSPDDQADMEAMFEELYHGLRRDVRLRGVTPQSLVQAVADPSGHLDKQLDFISGATGIPKRILIGSERGELASEQDENNWAARVTERRNNHATPHIIRPTIDRLIRYGVLPEPVGGYDVEWPESDSLGEEKRAMIAKTKAEAVAAYVSIPGAEQVVPPQEFRRWLGEAEESEFEPPEPALELDERDPEVAAAFAQNRRRIANATPRTLYVRRNVLNAEEIRKHFRAQGLETMVPAEEMHVTIAFSRAPVDWMKVGEACTHGDDGRMVIRPGGPRVVDRLGPKKEAIVLMFASSELCWRHEEIKRAGASWDWPDYQPHITITYEGDPELDVEQLEPYRGEIVLGPEIFEELTEDWSDGLTETRRR